MKDTIIKIDKKEHIKTILDYLYDYESSFWFKGCENDKKYDNNTIYLEIQNDYIYKTNNLGTIINLKKYFICNSSEFISEYVKTNKNKSKIPFKEVQRNDVVYDLELGRGVVIETNKYSFSVEFVVDYTNDKLINRQSYRYNGFRINGSDIRCLNQMLFWNKPKIIEDNTINLKETLFNKDFNTQRDDEETLNKCSKDIQKYINLLALRDQVTKDSRNYTFREDKDNYFIYYSNRTKQYEWSNERCMETLNVYFKTNIDAIKIRNILNEGRFRL